MRSRFDRFAIGGGGGEGGIKSRCQRRVKGGEIGRVRSRKDPCEGETNRDALLPYPYTAFEYMTPYFGTDASRFIYFVCMCWAIPR